jgi:hypothetical protein
MSTTVKVQIQQRIDTASNWASANPTPLSGEICWNSDDKKYKIGDGSTAWASLTYAPGSGGYTAGTGVSISASNVITASAVALTTVQTAANQTAHLALTTQEGDIVVRSDENKSYVRNSGSAGSMADYTLLATPTDAVLSVNGNTGAITADQLAAAIESATDSNTFTDADHTKLNGIDASANNYSISTDLLDEDNFSTNSATKVASQQSIKAYVDTADALKANLSGANFTGDVVFTGDAANVTWDKSTDDLIFNDNAKAIFGTSSDGVAIYHDGTHSYIKDSGTGNLVIQTNVLGIQAANGLEDLAKFSQDGSVDLFFDGTKKFESTSAGATLSGHLQLDGHLDMNDSHYIKLGTGDDLSIYHSGSLSMIDNTEGNLHIRNQATSGQIKIQPKSGEDGINVIQDGAVEAFFDNSKKFETVSWGARVTGTFEASTDIQVTDAGKFNAGSSNDLQIYNNGLNSYVANTTGYLFIQSDDFSVGAKSVGENMIVANVNDGVDLYFDGSKKAETTNLGFKFSGYLQGEDNNHIRLGTSDDFNFYHSGNENIVDCANGHQLHLKYGSEYLAKFIPDGDVSLFFDNSKKLESTSSGVTVTGTVSDSKGNVRKIPYQDETGSTHTLVASDADKVVGANNGVTIPASVLGVGDAVTIICHSGSSITLTQGSGLTLYNTANGNTGNRTLAARGMATIYFVSGTIAYISGAGLS